MRPVFAVHTPEGRRLSGWAAGIVSLAFLASMGFGESLFFGDQELGFEAPLRALTLYYLLLTKIVTLAAAALLFRDFLGALRQGFPAHIAFVACAYTLLSPIWSVSPLESLNKSLTLMLELTWAMGLAAGYGYYGIVRAVRPALWVIAASCFVLIILRPPFAFNLGDYAGYFRGLFLHKNILARALACVYILLVPFALFGAPKMPFRRECLGLAACCLLFIAIAQSATSMVICILVTALCVYLLLSKSLRAHTTLVYFAGVFGLIALGWAGWVFSGDLFEVLGRDATLTGRTMLWETVKRAIQLRPVLGYGFAAFWHSSEGALLFTDESWHPNHAHNGFLENALDGGMVFLFLVLVTTLAALLKSARWLMRGIAAPSVFLLLVATAMPLYNMLEATYIQDGSLPTIMLWFALALSALDLRDKTSQPPSG